MSDFAPPPLSSLQAEASGGFTPPPVTALQPAEDAAWNWRDFITGKGGFIREGLDKLAQGIQKMAMPSAQGRAAGIQSPPPGSRWTGAKQMLEGASSLVAPVAIGATLPALIEAPAATLSSLALGAGGAAAGGPIARKVTELAGGGAEAQDFADTAGSLALGAAGALKGPAVAKAAKAATELVKSPGVASMLKGGAKAAGGLAMLQHEPGAGILAMSEGAADIAKGYSKRAAALNEAAARLRIPTPVPEIQVPSGTATFQPEAAITAPAPPAQTPSLYAPPVSSTNPLPAAAAAPKPVWNPYSVSGPGLDSGALVTAAQRAAAAESPFVSARPVAAPAAAPPAAAPAAAVPIAAAPEVPAVKTVQAAPGAPEGANALLSDQEAAWLKKRTADTQAKDDAIATWMQKNGVESVAPGQPYADLVKQVNKDTGKRYGARTDAPDHPVRVAALNDLVASKNATAAAITNAAKLDQAGVSFAAAANMTPAQLGVATPLQAADTLFQLKKLSLAKTAPAAAALGAP